MPFTVQGLTSGTITGVQDEGVLLPPEHILNFTGGGVTVVDDPANGRTNVIVAVGAGGGWADDGTVVRLSTLADQVVVGALVPAATEKLRVVGQLRIDQGSLAAPMLFGSDSLFILSSNTAAVATSATFQNTAPTSSSGVIAVAGTVAAQQSGMAIIAVGSTSATGDAGEGLLQHYSGAGTTSLRIQSIDTATLIVTVIHARAYRSGAWAFGDVANSDTSAEAQAGITGLVLNIGAAAGGAITSIANQTALWNSAGQLNTQGHIGLGFWMAATQYGQLDSANTWRFGPDFASTPIYAPLGGFLANFSGTNVSDNVVAIQGRAAAASGLLSITGGAAAGSYGGILLGGFGTTYATAGLAGNGSIQQIGGATSRLVFSKISGALAGAANTGSIWQSGAWVIGEAANNDTSAEAQAGITGALISVSAIGANALTTVANQTVIFNDAGVLSLQGSDGQRFYVGAAPVHAISAAAAQSVLATLGTFRTAYGWSWYTRDAGNGANARILGFGLAADTLSVGDISFPTNYLGSQLGFFAGGTQYGQLDSSGIWRFGAQYAATPVYSGGTGTLIHAQRDGNSDVEVTFANGARDGSLLLITTGGDAGHRGGLFMGGFGDTYPAAFFAGKSLVQFLTDLGSEGSMIFRSATSAFASPVLHGRIWRSQAWTFGEAANNNTEAGAQAGLTGPLLNVSTITGGTITTAGSQAVLYNDNGRARLQGDAAADLEVGAGIVMVEARDLGTAREVVALCRGSAVTTTQMPASTGDRVIYIANATTDPAADPVSGHIEYGSGGAGVGRGSGSTVTTYVAA